MKKQTAQSLVFLLLAALLNCGCKGLLYTSYNYPLTQNFQDTPVGSKCVKYERYRIKEPFSGYGANVTVTIGELDELVRQAGMSKAYYADEKVLSILLGLYERREVIIYGD